MAAVEPMRVYQLLWLLIVHALHGRFRDEIHVWLSWMDGADGDERGGMAGGPVTDFTWAGDEDAFVVLDAHST